MSTVSCTSFTGRSTQSDPRDREIMVAETILHWRNLHLSLTFRTWLKFTRRRKLQKELLNYLTNNKINELMSKTLATWRRELYTTVTARQHWVRISCNFSFQLGFQVHFIKENLSHAPPILDVVSFVGEIKFMRDLNVRDISQAFLFTPSAKTSSS